MEQTLGPEYNLKPLECPKCKCYILTPQEMVYHLRDHETPEIKKYNWRKSQYNPKIEYLSCEDDKVLYQKLLASGNSSDSKYTYNLSDYKKYIQRRRVGAEQK